MTILALEFSSDRRSVALARDGQVLAEVTETGGRATPALGMIERALAAAATPREAIQTIAVGLGPGSYTGIRAAIALARGWQLARGVRLLGVSGVAALAAQAQAEKLFGNINLAVDAQRGEFYLATWAVSDIELRETSPLKIVPADALATLQNAGEIIAGPQAGQTLFPSAAMIARLAARRHPAGGDDPLDPVYLRPSDFVKSPARPDLPVGLGHFSSHSWTNPPDKP